MADKCIFCNPAPNAVIFQGPDGIVLLDDPIRLGHVLVGVAEHRASLSDVTPDEAAKLMALACRTSKALVALTGAEKTYVVAIGDKDKHFHVHLIPRMTSDPLLGPHVFGGNGWATFLPPTVDSGELHRLSEDLSRSLKGS